MKTVPVVDLFLVTYYIVDNRYRQKGYYLVNRIFGVRPVFSDSELLTLMIAVDFFEFSGGRRYLPFIRANYLNLFPDLPGQSQFNRRLRKLRLILDELRKDRANQLNVCMENHFLLDTAPVIAVGYNRNKKHSSFPGSADYGYCACRRMKYFGYKLVMLMTPDGIPYGFEPVPANTGERDAADEIPDTLPAGDNVPRGDKGFIGKDRQSEWKNHGIRIWTAMRENQHIQNPPQFDKLLNSVRERTEGAFDLLKESGCSAEKTLAKTVDGLCSRIIAKITCLTFRYFLKRFFKINILNYTADF